MFSGGVPRRIGSPSQDREGPCRSVGGPVPGARRSSPASRSEPASIFSTGMLCQGPGDRTWSRQTSTLVHHKGEATAREDPARVNRRKAAYSERCTHQSTAPRTKPMVWRHGPRLDMEASGLARRSAQHLTPLRGRPLPHKQEAMEREGAEVEVQRPKLRTRACKFGPHDPTSWSHLMAT